MRIKTHLGNVLFISSLQSLWALPLNLRLACPSCLVIFPTDWVQISDVSDRFTGAALEPNQIAPRLARCFRVHCGHSGSQDPACCPSLEQHQAVFSTLIGPAPTRLGSHWSRASECYLRQKSYGIKNQHPKFQSPLLRASERKIPLVGGILLAPRWFFMA